MITTVTVSTVTTMVAMGLTTVVTIAAVVSLLFFLIAKELTSAQGSGTSLRIAKFLSVGIVPLAMAFVVIVAVRIAEVLG